MAAFALVGFGFFVALVGFGFFVALVGFGFFVALVGSGSFVALVGSGSFVVTFARRHTPASVLGVGQQGTAGTNLYVGGEAGVGGAKVGLDLLGRRAGLEGVR